MAEAELMDPGGTTFAREYHRRRIWSLWEEYLRGFEGMAGFGPNDPGRKRAVILVEDRDLPHTPLVIASFRHFLGPDWNFWMHAPMAGPWTSVEGFNRTMTSIYFWQTFTEDHILIIQSDTACTGPLRPDFSQYDYIGAPCGPGGSVLNGGLSLRKPKAMLMALTLEERPDGEPEDVYFTRVLRNIGKIPPISVAEAFSVENTACYHGIQPFGVHGTTKGYVDVATAERIIKEAQCSLAS